MALSGTGSVLFNSVEFIFLFLPVALGAFWALLRVGNRAAALWLLACSLFFYGWWSPRHVVLLLLSIAFNHAVGLALCRAAAGPRRRLLLAVGVGGDLLLLAFFKYADFLLHSLSGLPGVDLEPLGILLPIGISFYTFTQIAFLVDAARGEAREYDPVHYALFVTYFPHLIAGPILHHKEMMPQFKALAPGRLGAEDLAVGLTIFVVGLFKKVVLADGVARFVPFAFGAEAEPTLVAAWTGALAYTLQLYFDFSGYSDMAVGLSRMFGVDLPLNFASPYKSTSIIEFWRRWHMTLSRFLRDYLYIPLGGGRRGPARRHANLMATMLLGGLWHGAGWTFVLWGGLHSAYLVANHLWRALKARLGLFPGEPTRPRLLVAGALTFVAVVVAWVPFRAESFAEAQGILAGMAGLNGTTLGALPEELSLPLAWLWIAGLLALAWLAPNTQEIMARHLPQMRRATGAGATAARGLLLWRPTAWHAALLGIAAVIALGHLANVSEFLYFQF
jgi:D-alanyl-lipoteichoic acid acyltransferase DltB (MBOAT superfamily)